jgi:hypothetical protein
MADTRGTAGIRPIVTVGDLIDRLRAFSPDAPIRTQGALTDETDFIIGVGESPNEPGAIAVVYTPRPH